MCQESCSTSQHADVNRDCVADSLKRTGGMVADKGSCVCLAGTTLGPKDLQCIKS